jgi:putative addiction module killer protein
MAIVQKTETFAKWFNALKDEIGKAHIARRIRRIETEDFFGDCEPVGEKLFELRIHYGPGYRVYFERLDNDTIVLVLRAGIKKTQRKDIKKAKKQARED